MTQWRRHFTAAVFITTGVILVILYGGYLAGWTQQGLLGTDSESLWDWLDLLIVPVVFGGGAIWFNHRRGSRMIILQFRVF